MSNNLNKEYHKEYNKNYRAINREKLLKNAREYHKAYYQKNKDRVLANSRAYYRENRAKVNNRSKQKRIEFMEWWINYKSVLKCERCNESFWFCLDFHHNELGGKEYPVNILVNRRRKDLLLEEIKKCIVLCANCHRKEHYDWTVNGRGDSFVVPERYRTDLYKAKEIETSYGSI